LLVALKWQNASTVTMPNKRREEPKPRGVFERPPGSGVGGSWQQSEATKKYEKLKEKIKLKSAKRAGVWVKDA